MAKWLAHHGVAHSSLGYIAGVTGMQSRRRSHPALGLLATTGAPLLYLWTILLAQQLLFIFLELLLLLLLLLTSAEQGLAWEHWLGTQSGTAALSARFACRDSYTAKP
jgi:hypothetical protein